MRRVLTPFRVTVAVLVLFLAAIVFLNGLGEFNTDIKPEVYLDPWRTAGSYLSAWLPSPYLGSPNFNVGLVPVLAVVGVLRSVGLSPEWAFKVFHLGLWLVAAWGASRLLRELTPRISRWAALGAGVFYLANPYTVQAGSTLAISLPLALLPWQLCCFLRALRADTRWGRWAWAGLFGLSFFAMSGMNAGVVPVIQLLALLPLAVFARVQWRLGWWHILWTIARCALFVLGVSLYWLVPAVSAQATGSSITAASETVKGIAQVSSYPEVLRGMGLWPLYGYDATGAWLPQFQVFVISPLIMLLTIVWPALALVSLRWTQGLARWFCAAAVAVAAVIMVGAFPGDRPASPFGSALTRLLAVPALSAFRTTNKIGSVLALAFALSIGAALIVLARRLRRRPVFVPVAGAAGIALLTAWILPALTGNLYISPLDIPSYWTKAAAAADQGNPDSALLILPGQVTSRYRWSTNRPDDLANALFTRNVILPYTTPNASAPAANFTAAFDDTLQSGSGSADFVSTAARYLGADKVLLRHDIDWQTDGGAPPEQTAQALGDDTGLVGLQNYGRPGEYLFGPADAPVGAGVFLPPLQLFGVSDPTTTLRAESASRSLLVSGDGWSLPAMARAGLLTDRPSFQYAQGLSDAQWRAALSTAGRLVLTDTNARRDTFTNRLTNNQGALLTPDQPLTVTRTLGADSDDQTVLVPSGATVTASGYGGAFFGMPYAVPQNALDGDPDTAWLVGDFGTADGQWLQISQPRAQRLDTIGIAQTSNPGGVHIDQVTVRAGGVTRTVRLPDSGYGRVDLGGVGASTVRITIDSTRGTGYNLVGIRDVQMPGPLARRTARTPLTFDTAYRKMDAAGRAQFDRTPLDVLLTRVLGTASTGDDAEPVFRRLLTLPDDRTFSGTAAVRVTGGPAQLERIYDDAAGLSTSVRASSSGFSFDNPGVRAALAADGAQGTDWIPASTAASGMSLTGAWWQIDSAVRDITSVRVEQQRGYGDTTGASTRWAQRVAISVDGRPVAVATLATAGTTTVPIPQRDGRPVRGSVVRMTILSDTGARAGPAARFPTIDTGVRVKVAASGADDAPDPCRAVATLDGSSLWMRPVARTLSDANSAGTTWRTCRDQALSAGQHQIDQADGFTIDSLSLMDALRTDASSRGESTAKATVSQQILRNDATHKTIRLDGRGPANVLIGQSYDQRWQATANGEDLGAPQVIDGYSTGWRLELAGPAVVDITYRPQVGANIALGASAVFVLAALLLAGRWRRLRGQVEIAAGTVRLVTPRPAARMGLEFALIATAGFCVGVPGLVAAVATIAATRLRPVSTRLLQLVGAGLIVVSMVLYLILLGDARGTLTANAVSQHLWPHYLAGAGLVLALAGTVRTLWRPAGESGVEDD